MKKNKQFQILLCILCLANLAFSQNAEVLGNVSNTNNQALKNAKVKLLELKKTTTTNEFGFYRFENLKSGTYTLEVTLDSFQIEIKNFGLANNQSLKVDFVLKDKVLQMDEVKVLASSINEYRIDSNLILAKMPLKDLENPQVYNSIPQKLMQDQVVTELGDAMKNATGVARLWESTGRGGDGAEFYSMRGFSVQPTLINGVPGVNNGVLDPINIESIDVLKGPSGTLFGSPVISYGGLINVSTKKPFDKLAGNLGFVLGSFGQYRFTGDVNLPISNKAAVRINTAYNDQKNFQDAGFRKSFVFAPSFKFTPNERLTFLINTEFQFAEAANAPMFFLNRYAPLSHHSIDAFEKLYTKSYTSNDLTIKNPTVNLQAQALIKLSKHWTSQTILSSSQSKNNGYYHYLWDLSDGNTFARYISKRNGETQTVDIQQNFLGQFNLGRMKNKLLIGLDYFHSNISNGSSAWVSNGVVTVLDGKDSGFLSQNGVDSLLATSFDGVSQVKNQVLSAYISDVIYFTPSLSAMLSVRLDQFSGATNYWSTDKIESQITASPKFGLVYQPWKDKIALFANYMNGFINQAPVQVADSNGANVRMQTLKPEQANQFEFGFKTNLWKEKIAFTASYYNILVNNKVMSDPNNFNGVIQGGRVKSEGIELSLIANPLKGLNLMAGYSINKAKVVKDDPANGYLGLRPEEAGPENLINIWVQYTLPSTKLKGLGIGFGANYASKYATLNRAVTGTFYLPEYTVLNAALSYKTKAFDLIVKLDNILNTKYYSGWSTITPQQLRSIALSFNYKF